jgi:hypothetical protein
LGKDHGLTGLLGGLLTLRGTKVPDSQLISRWSEPLLWLVDRLNTATTLHSHPRLNII